MGLVTISFRVLLDMIMPEMGDGDTDNRLKEINSVIKGFLLSEYSLYILRIEPKKREQQNSEVIPRPSIFLV